MGAGGGVALCGQAICLHIGDVDDAVRWGKARKWWQVAGALADILIVDCSPQEDITVLGGQTKWFLDKEVPEPIKTLRVSI